MLLETMQAMPVTGHLLIIRPGLLPKCWESPPILTKTTAQITGVRTSEEEKKRKMPESPRTLRRRISLWRKVPLRHIRDATTPLNLKENNSILVNSLLIHSSLQPILQTLTLWRQLIFSQKICFILTMMKIMFWTRHKIFRSESRNLLM